MSNFLKTSASIVLTVLFCLANAGWKETIAEYKSISDPNEKLRYISGVDPSDNLGLLYIVTSIQSTTSAEVKKSLWKELDAKLDLYAEAPAFSSDAKSQVIIAEIKSNEVYESERKLSGSSWFEKLMKKLRAPEVNTPKVDGPSVEVGWLEGVIKFFYWTMVVAAIGAAVYVVYKLPIKWNKIARSKKVTRGGMLEDGEELKSEDEYALAAEALVQEGRYREACRAYYLASLLRIDALRIARFEPAQTNWEHLRRIESSRKRPEGFEFREITKKFDYAWYGYEAKTELDVVPFRRAYSEIVALGEKAA
ncbi:MAG TPA: hypothetical protein VK171_14220 [Fimbriimonas sp.]|nr:hypothetical protein [Fimbriimonas sp.]